MPWWGVLISTESELSFSLIEFLWKCSLSQRWFYITSVIKHSFIILQPSPTLPVPLASVALPPMSIWGHIFIGRHGQHPCSRNHNHSGCCDSDNVGFYNCNVWLFMECVIKSNRSMWKTAEEHLNEKKKTYRHSFIGFEHFSSFRNR